MNRIARFYWILLAPACFLTIGCSFLGYMAVGWGRDAYGALLMFAFPLFLLVLVSLRLTVLLLWVYLGVLLFNGFNLSSGVDRWLFTAAILTQIAYSIKQHWQQPEIRSLLFGRFWGRSE